jgi:hypothetical protein
MGRGDQSSKRAVAAELTACPYDKPAHGSRSRWGRSSLGQYRQQGLPLPGHSLVGKTKLGSYMSEAEARAQGARPDHGKACTS